jgi:hypothetical protein
LDNNFGVGYGFGIALSICHAACKFRDFNDESFIGFAPINN